jgi:hypothetical protein
VGVPAVCQDLGIRGDEGTPLVNRRPIPLSLQRVAAQEIEAVRFVHQ